MIRELLIRQKNWDKIAVFESGRNVSYRDLARKATAIRNWLCEKSEENIAIFLPNSWEYIAALFGTFMSGATAFPINVQLKIHEITPLLTHASVHTVITSTAFASLFNEVSDYFHENLQIAYVEEICANHDISLEALAISTYEPMVLLSTSGTTSSSKLVQLSDKNVETAVMGYLSYIDYERFDQSTIRYLLATPFSSVYGILILSVCLIKSFPIVITKGAFNLDTLYRAAQEHKVTHYEGGTSIPILMDQMSGHPIPYDISSLKFIGFGGSKVSADTLGRLVRRYPNLEFCQGYGMTESASLIARHMKKMYEDKFDSVGMAIPNVTISVDIDGTITDAPFMTGEIVAKGPNVMLGYYNNEEETNNTIKNNYLYTGDIGYLDEDGYVYICGRKKNVIMVRGFSVYSEEVENCLLNSGLVEDCFVYSGTDSFKNEVVCADVVLSTPQVSTNDIRIYCAKHLAEYKHPQRIQVVETIKKTATGKSERRTDGAC